MSETLNSTRLDSDSGSNCLSPTLTRSFALVRSINQKLYKKPTNCATSWLAVPTFLFHMPLLCSLLHFPVPLSYSLFPVPCCLFPLQLVVVCNLTLLPGEARRKLKLSSCNDVVRLNPLCLASLDQLGVKQDIIFYEKLSRRLSPSPIS